MENNPVFQKIYGKTAQYCSENEHCRSQVRNKLLQWRVESSWIDDILSKLEKDDFLNEDRYAELFVRSKVRQNGWGRIKIMQALHFDRVNENSVQKGFVALDENIYRETLAKILQKAEQTVKAGNEKIKEQKIMAHAASKGFEINLIKEIYKKIKEPE